MAYNSKILGRQNHKLQMLKKHQMTSRIDFKAQFPINFLASPPRKMIESLNKYKTWQELQLKMETMHSVPLLHHPKKERTMTYQQSHKKKKWKRATAMTLLLQLMILMSSIIQGWKKRQLMNTTHLKTSFQKSCHGCFLEVLVVLMICFPRSVQCKIGVKLVSIMRMEDLQKTKYLHSML